MNTAVSFRHVSKTYGARNNTQHALDDVSFDVPAGSFYGVIGSSGAGKSTLLRTVNGLETPTSGMVRTFGKEPTNLGKRELSELRGEIGMIFQRYNLLQSKTVAQNIAIPLILAGESKHSIIERVHEVLDLVGLNDRTDAYPSQLSGGQCQRVGIARALVTNPKVLLSDEATSALDPVATRQILDLLRDINEKYGITVLLITHQMSVIARVCEHVVVLSHGKIVEQGEVSDVFAHPRNPLTKEFVETVISRRLPDDLIKRVASGAEGTTLTINYRNDANKYVLAEIQRTLGPSDISLLYASENRLRGATLGTLVIGLQGIDVSSLYERLKALQNKERAIEVIHV